MEKKVQRNLTKVGSRQESYHSGLYFLFCCSLFFQPIEPSPKNLLWLIGKSSVWWEERNGKHGKV